MRDGRTNDKQLKIELLSQWNLEAEFRNFILGKERKKVGIRSDPPFYRTYKGWQQPSMDSMQIFPDDQISWKGLGKQSVGD